ncbi:DNA-binding transcriptional regulator, MarR family [Pseudomonas flavescens]|uniref:DNA-binding transcriptional regulator, MarR family n=1 Tax=Phytopseudomonas flavescens TaxID=29435 RepID=A0A1G8DXP2_9GAMM|nr:bifunctional helix-turn-helix transcriptional regulator/GNAT family N-acetyltransferase [Pseudomonas flavescens]SDH62444.1 DNA-binding transcriptional regulator, MarR family [Pseudomonas flavescens]
MSHTEISLVDAIRASSRTIVRELGFMQSTLAATDYPPSAVHALLEIGARGAMTSAQLADCLGLDKSSISRMVRKLAEAGELQEAVRGEDGRAKPLILTAQGQRTLVAIQAFGRQQVGAALQRLSPAQQHTVAQGLATYAQALEARRLGAPGAAELVRIEMGYRPGCIGRVAEMHADFYSLHWGFGQFFEAQVANGMAEFTGRLGNSRNGLWLAMQEGKIVGSVAIDGEHLSDNQAHLRWFVIDDGWRGAGLGRRLLSEALVFCDRQGFSATQLWTFQGLDAARRLYESFDFGLVEACRGRQWGAEVVEQRFLRPARSLPG